MEEIALYNTTFRKMDGGIVMFNNALISATGFSNLARSGLHNESFKARSLPCRTTDVDAAESGYNNLPCHICAIQHTARSSNVMCPNL